MSSKFSGKLKGRIKKLSSRYSASLNNRKILDEIYLEVAGQSIPMKRLLLSVYAGILRVVPDAKETRQTKDTSQLLADIAKRRVRELPHSMEQAREVSETRFKYLQSGGSEAIFAADIGPAASVLLNLFTSILKELGTAEQESWSEDRNPDPVFKLWHNYMFRGAQDITDELERQWSRDEKLREKMPAHLTIEEWMPKHVQNRRRWMENTDGGIIDPVNDQGLIKQASAEGIPLNSPGTNEVFTWQRYMRVVNTISSIPNFKRLQLQIEDSTDKAYKESRHSVIAGPFKTMRDLWERLIAFEKRREEDAQLEDLEGSSAIQAVEQKTRKAINNLTAKQAALEKQLTETCGSVKEKWSLNAIAGAEEAWDDC